MVLTVNEIKVLDAVAKSEYGEGIRSTVWTFTIGDNSDLKPKSIPGVVSSLVKKGYLASFGSGREACVAVTQSGVEAYEALKRVDLPDPDTALAQIARVKEILALDEPADMKIGRIAAAISSRS